MTLSAEATAPNTQKIQLAASWLEHLNSAFLTPTMQDLRKFLVKETQARKVIYPRGSEIFAALQATDFDKVKVVILGQDPYHGPNQAHGLAFSVRKGVAIPPSLRNIYQELKNDLGVAPPNHGDLTGWAKQGVLLLNSVLTVESGRAGSHQNRGWEFFTDQVIRALEKDREHLVFVLWGSYAQKKAQFIDRSKHFVIECVHPSPLSAHRGFMGSKPFSKINTYLAETGQQPIDWKL